MTAHNSDKEEVSCVIVCAPSLNDTGDEFSVKFRTKSCGKFRNEFTQTIQV